MAEGSHRLGWMDGVKVALGYRGMKVDAARRWAKDGKEWRIIVTSMSKGCIVKYRYWYYDKLLLLKAASSSVGIGIMTSYCY